MGVSLQDINRTVGGEVHLADINLELESGSRNVRWQLEHANSIGIVRFF